MDGYGVRVDKSDHYFQKFVEHSHNLFQPTLFLKQAVVDNMGIHSHHVKCMENYWHPNAPAPKIIPKIKN